jgi:hypothetical protein
MRRFILAIKCFFAVLFGRSLPPEIVRTIELPAPTAPKALPEGAQAQPQAPAPAPPASAPGAVDVLALLQREGRLIDFLEEPIDGYGDAQIGAAVRDIHRGCKKVLSEYFAIEPVMTDGENAQVTVQDGFDARAIRLVGNVVGQPPFRGVLRHHGWRTTRVALPGLREAQGPAILAPAEVELA